MLPWLKKPAQQAGVIVKTREPDEKPEESDYNEGLTACGHDILQAIEKKDSKALGEALHAAFQICELEPHEEGEHIDNSFDAQNKKAGE